MRNCPLTEFPACALLEELDHKTIQGGGIQGGFHSIEWSMHKADRP